MAKVALPTLGDHPGPRRAVPVLSIILVATVGLFFLVRCSGLNFPMLGPRSTLNGHLSRDLGLSLPAGAKVTHAARQAYVDPAEFFVVEMPVADAQAFMARVRSAPGQPRDMSSTESWRVGPPAPAWWKPQDLQNVRRVFHADQQGGYIWCYSDSTGTVYVYRFRT